MLWNEKKGMYSMSLIAILFSVLFVKLYLNNESWIHSWDSWSYWNNFETYTRFLKRDFSSAITHLFYTINNNDFNLTSMLYLSPMSIFGDDRFVYITAIIVIFGSLVTLSSFLIIKEISNDKKNIHILFSLIVTLLFSVVMWRPILSAMPGLGGVAIMNFSIYFLIKGIKSNGLNAIKFFTLLGFSLTLLILFRRWYGYWILTFYFISPLISIIFCKNINFKKISFILFCYFVSGLSALSSLLFLANGWVLSMLKTDYTNLYSAYRFGNLFDQVISIVTWPTILMMILGVVALSKKSLPLLCFILFQSLFTGIIFLKTQDFSIQHYYLFSPFYTLLIPFAIMNVFSENSIVKKISFAFTGLYICTFLYVFTGLFNSILSKEHTFSLLQRPLYRSDLNEINNLRLFIEPLINNNNHYLYVLSSSGVMNDDILRNSIIDDNIKQKILLIKHIDLRDGFPHELFSAKYILVPYTPQHHLDSDSQRIVTHMSQLIVDAADFGRAYSPIGREYILHGDNKFQVFSREFAISSEDLQIEIDRFQEWYPFNELFDITNNHCGIFKPGVILDKMGLIENSCSSIFMHPGNQPVSISTYPFLEDKVAKLTFSFRDSEIIESSCGINSGNVNVNIYIDDKLQYTKNISHKEITTEEIFIPLNSELKIEVTKGLFDVNCDWFTITNIKFK